jgi:GNAT superfamily N-acetyltransferase
LLTILQASFTLNADIPGFPMPSMAYKRFRMQVELRNAYFDPPELPDGYRWLPWKSLLLERHAQVKWRSFRNDLDGKVFSSLGDAAGCLALMKEIASQTSFCPAATWMVVFQPEPDWPPNDCGTIQGVTRKGGIGAIQNVGVTPEHRGQGIGRALVVQALRGFIQCGMGCSILEVTAENEAAVRLYQSLGFDVIQVLYRDSGTGETVPDSEVHSSASRWSRR